MANVKRSAMTFPYPLGKILPGANFATACVPLTQKVTPVEEDGSTTHKRFKLLEIRAWGGSGTVTGNSGIIFLCNNASAPDQTNFLNVIDVLSPGEAWPRGQEYANVIDITAIYVGAENATDFVIANIVEY